MVPLFHDVDYRIASPAVRGLQLHSTAPYVNYVELGKTAASGQPAAPERADRRRRPPRARSRASCAASTRPLIGTVEQAEVLPCVYETLTWAVEGTRIVPWLACEVLMENDGTRYRFRLQSGVRFHDGRRLTARDVRHSWERLLLNKREREPLGPRR